MLGGLIAVAIVYSLVAGVWWVALAVVNVFVIFFLDEVGEIAVKHLELTGRKEFAGRVGVAVSILTSVVGAALLALSIVFAVGPGWGTVAGEIVEASLVVEAPATVASVMNMVKEINKRKNYDSTLGSEGTRIADGSVAQSNRREEIARELEELRERLARKHRRQH